MAIKKKSKDRSRPSESRATSQPTVEDTPREEARPAEKDVEATPLQSCPVIGFGASAGGLEAMTEVLHHLPPDLGAAIVFIQHLDPKHSSMLTELLARTIRMPVQQVTDGMRIDRGRIYVIAPNTCIGIHNGRLVSQPRNPGVPHMPIDFFFRSLAGEQGSKAIGVVLSGTASDGTMGLKAIKEAGGITFAQEPETAKYDGMPRSAIVAGYVDSVLPPAGIADELVRLSQHPYMDRRRPSDELPEDEKAFEEILGMLRTAKGVDFAQYKPGTVHRRTFRRMAIHRVEKPEQYARFLKAHREELDLLFQDILIHVTSFFREPTTFKALASYVLPAVLKARSQDDPVRIWVPGCATGEEAYSVAICALECMRQAGVEVALQVFGTDLSEIALEQARTGVFPQSIESDVSPERLRRFFVSANGKYQIARSVRDVCIFARQNVTKDPPFSRLDLITCRNLLIYLGSRLQSKVLRLFHYALKPSGFLALGASENLGDTGNELFAPVDRQHKIYARKPARMVIDSDLSDGYVERAEAPHPPAAAAQQEGAKSVDQLILAHYSPPAVVIDEDLRILQFRGDTSPYLRHSPGGASLNFTKLARGGIATEVRAMLYSPEVKTGPMKSKPLAVPIDGTEKKITVSILPVHGAPEPQYLVAFEPAAAEPGRSIAKQRTRTGRDANRERVAELEEELASTKRYLHSVIQQQEAAAEELKSAHEEVQSSNEELQSTNEELLTAKEELQSTNEELTTVNDEMQSRNAELQQINNDLINLLSSVNIPIVMLGNDLQIRRFTPHAERILNLLPGDVGRPVSDFRLKINVPDLVELCQEVVDRLVPREREVQDAEGRIYTMWVRPYRTADNRIDGVVLSLFDITERKQAAEARYRRLFEAAKDGIVVADVSTGEIVDSNPFVSKLLRYARTQLIGTRFWESDLFRNSEITEAVLDELHASESLQKSITLTSESGQQVPVDIIASLYSEADRTVIQFNIRDVSARKRMEEQARRNEEQLRDMQKMEAVGRLAGGVAHDFNNILTAITGFAELLREHLDGDSQGVRMLEQIRNGADRATAITRQLLTFGRKQIVTPAVLDLNAVLTDFRQMISVMLPRNVELEFEPEADLGRVRADRTQAEQVILNLVLNARDAMPDGGTVTVATSNVEADTAFAANHPTVPVGNYVALTVRDTGAGMDPQTQARIFEPFFTTKPKGVGTGLGLATVYSIVNQSGGHILAYSELGVGTTFTVYLPRVNGELASLPEIASAATDGTETILLVEDQSPVRELARRFLEMAGYHILEAPNGPEALRVSREYPERIHLMVTDVVMPRMSGRELALQLASERPDMQVLYMSGNTEEAIVHHGVLKEGVELLQKPFTQRDLLGRVRRILDHQPEGKAPAEGERPTGK